MIQRWPFTNFLISKLRQCLIFILYYYFFMIFQIYLTCLNCISSYLCSTLETKKCHVKFLFCFFNKEGCCRQAENSVSIMGNATDIHQRRPRRNRVSAGTALTVRCREINGHCEVNLGPGTVMERIRLTEGRKTCSLMRLRQVWLCTLPQRSSKSSRRTKIFIIDLTAALPNEVPSAYLLFNFYETEGPHIAGCLPRWP